MNVNIINNKDNELKVEIESNSSTPEIYDPDKDKSDEQEMVDKKIEPEFDSHEENNVQNEIFP